MDINQLERDLAAALRDHRSVDEQLTEERLALIVEGEEITADDARHLLGSQASRDLLVVLGEGLAELEPIERRPRPPSFTTPTPPKRMATVSGRFDRRRNHASLASVGLFLCAALAFAGVGYVGYQALLDRSLDASDQQDSRPDRQSAGSRPAKTSAEPTQSKTIPLQKSGRSVSKTHLAPVSAEPELIDPPVSTKEAGQRAGLEPALDGAVMPLPPKKKQSNGIGHRSTNTPLRAARPSLDSGPQKALDEAVKKGQRRYKARLGTQRLEQRRGPIEVTRQAISGPSRGFGQLRLNSKPAAEVFIDGRSRGWTPVIDLRLQAGPHDVRLVYSSPLANKPEERFRVIIKAEQTWGTVRDNRKRVDGPLK
ncbi:MAG: hypothetical protein CMH52_08650 [Myxococcales bacterium]|nr:hypothetical protein [Myxococcales bacterium]